MSQPSGLIDGMSSRITSSSQRLTFGSSLVASV
jgi:hypothetical protein